MFCVECGREGELIGPLCHDCYSRKKVIVDLPQYIDLTLCSHCSSFLMGGRWAETESVKEAVEMLLMEAISAPNGMQVDGLTVQLTEKDQRTFEAAVAVELVSEGHRFDRKLTTTVRLKHGSCKECSKQRGNYYEAIIQLRGDDRALTADVERRMERQVTDRIDAMRAGSREVFLTKVEHVKGGVDFYVSTAQSARIISREFQDSFSAEFKESSSLWGRQDGRDVYRVTFLVRLPRFGVGDVITCYSQDYYIRTMSKGVVRCIALPSGEERQMKVHDLESCTVSCQASGIGNAIVLTERDSELQLLDPDSMEPVDVIKPRGFRRDGEQIRFVRTSTGTHVLSDSW